MSYGSKHKIDLSELDDVRSKLALLKLKKQVPNDYIPPFTKQPYSTDYPSKLHNQKETVPQSHQKYREKYFPGEIAPAKKEKEYGKMSKLATIAQNNLISNPKSSPYTKPPVPIKHPNHYEEEEEDKLEKPIHVAANKKNQFAEENETENVERIPCRHCGRKFAEKALEKHEINCEKVFFKKRKVFNIASKRLVSTEQAKLMQENKTETKAQKQPVKTKKIPKWKMLSEQFRNAVGSTVGKTKDGPTAQDLESFDRVPCPYCGRSFKDETAKRHIPFCKNKNELDKIKATSKRKPIVKKK